MALDEQNVDAVRDTEFFDHVVDRLVNSGLTFKQVLDNRDRLLPLIRQNSSWDALILFSTMHRKTVSIDNLDAFVKWVYDKALEILENKAKC